MTDQGASKEVQQYATIASLKEITLSANKFLKKETKKGSKQKELKFKAKVVDQQLADESGFINFKVAEGVNLNNYTTYELTGLLSIINYKLNLTVTSATPVQQIIANLGNEQFSNVDFDPFSGRSIVQVKDLLTHRIGQSFFAKVKEVTLQEEKRVKAILADATGAIESDISINSKRITSEVLKSLSTDKVYLFSDTVLFFNENNQLVSRFNYRSNIVEVDDRQIQQLSNFNLSAKQYSDATEKNDLTDILKIREKINKKQQIIKPKKQNRPRRDHSQNQRTFRETTPVKINELQQWNNNQTFIGKIVSLNVETKQPRNQIIGKSEMHYLKGQVGDETGVIDFDMAEKKDNNRFQVGDIVKFSQAMNKGRNSQEDKVGGHYVEIKRFGRYTIINDVVINNVNQSNNLSTFTLTPNPHPRKNESITGKLKSVKVEDGEGDQKLYTYTVQNENGQQSITIPQNITKFKEGEEVTIRKKNIKQRRNQGQSDRNRSSSQRSNQFIGFKNESITGKFQSVKVEDGEGDQKLYTYTVQNENGQQSITIPQNITKFKEGEEVTIRKKNIKQRRNQGQSDRNRSSSQRRNYRNQQQDQDNHRNNQIKGRSTSEKNYRNNRSRDNYNGENRSERGNNNQRNNSNYNQRNNERNNEGYRNNRNQSNNGQRQNNNRQIRKTKIIDLEPGKRGQIVTGQVIEVENFSKQIGQKTLHFVKGRIADETGNIRFDIKKPQFDINNGQVITLDGVNNKVDDNGFHYIDVLSNGGVHYSKKQFYSVNNQRGGDSDRSSIEYVKKTVPN